MENEDNLSIYKRIWRKTVPKKVRFKIGFFMQQILYNHKTRFGDENPKQIFWLIRCERTNAGLYSLIFDNILDSIQYAIKNGYTPVIDMKNYSVDLMQDVECRGKENAWEYYYQQPNMEYTLEDVYRSKRVMVRPINEKRKVLENSYIKCYEAEEVKNKYFSLISGNLKLAPELSVKVNKLYQQLFPQNEKVLGVSVRAAFRAGMLQKDPLFKHHPKAPSLEELIKKIEVKKKEWNCQSIFLVSDDREYQKKIKEYFGDDCFFLERKLTRYFDKGKVINDVTQKLIEFEGYSTRKRNEDYVIETHLLAKCNSLYASLASGVQFSYFLNSGKYENYEFYDKGFI